MSNGDNLSKQLPNNEWDFSKSIEEFGLDLTFLYEYCRQAAIEYDEFDLLYNRCKATFSRTLTSKYKEYAKDIKENERQINRHPFAPFLIRVLANIENLKSLPLVENEAFRKSHNVWPMNIDHEPWPLCSLDIRKWPKFESLTTDMMEPITYEYEHLFNDDSNSGSSFQFHEMYCYKEPICRESGFLAYAMFEFNWVCSDSEMVEEFKKFLEQNRPPRFRGRKKKPYKEQHGLYQVIPTFDRKIALEWLSVYRRWKAAKGTFNDLLDLKYPDLDDDDDSRFERVTGNAGVIVEWAAKGGVLKDRKSGGNSKSEWMRIDAEYWIDKYPDFL